MNRKQAYALKVGDTLEADFSGKVVRGRVVHVNPGTAVNVHWEDGEKSATHPLDIVASSWAKVS